MRCVCLRHKLYYFALFSVNSTILLFQLQMYYRNVNSRYFLTHSEKYCSRFDALGSFTRACKRFRVYLAPMQLERITWAYTGL